MRAKILLVAVREVCTHIPVGCIPTEMPPLHSRSPTNERWVDPSWKSTANLVAKVDAAQSEQWVVARGTQAIMIALVDNATGRCIMELNPYVIPSGD